MLSLEVLDSYSWVLSLLSLSKGIPYAWNSFLQRMRIASLQHLLIWLFIFLHSWAHFSLVSIRLVLCFSILPSPQKAIHILWVCASSLQAILQLPFVLQSEELLEFSNLLIKESTAISDCLQRKSVPARIQLKKQERLLELILFAFAGAAIVFPAFVLAIFFFNPLQSQFLFASLPQELQSFHILVLIACGLYEVFWTTFTWITLIFFMFLEFSFFFLSQALLKSYRDDLELSYGTKRWVMDYRRLQIFQVRFNNSVGRIVLPFQAFVFLLGSLIGNYCSILFFQIRNQLHILFYLYFPFITIIVIIYELIMYPWIGSIHSISASPSIRSRKVSSTLKVPNPGSLFHPTLTSAYARSLVPLQVKLGLFRNISKFSILSVMTFTVVSTARLVILF